MIFDDVKVGDQFRERNSGRLITVTELSAKGFHYTCEPYSIKIGYNGVVPEFGTVKGGELFVKDHDLPEFWDLLYDKVNVCLKSDQT